MSDGISSVKPNLPLSRSCAALSSSMRWIFDAIAERTLLSEERVASFWARMALRETTEGVVREGGRKGVREEGRKGVREEWSE